MRSPRARRRSSTPLATQAVELSLAVPQVVAHRLAAIAIAGHNPSASHRREMHLMGTEKIAAFYESWAAMSWEMGRACLEMWTWWIPEQGGAAHRAHRTAHAILSSGLAPIHRRAMANARRLGRTR
jgi:hypothetical protein